METFNEDSVKPKKYNTFILLNKPVYFWGFTAVQLAVSVGGTIMLTIVSFMIFHLLIGTVVFLILGIPIYRIMGRIRKENSKGNPDYVSAYFNYRKNPKYITDREGVIKLIYKNKARRYIKNN